MTPPRWLFWHRRDLRLADNLGLADLAAITPAMPPANRVAMRPVAQTARAAASSKTPRAMKIILLLGGAACWALARQAESRADAAATDQSSVKYLMVQNPGRYRSPAYAWSPQTYACAVKRGDQDWLNFVNTALHEAMTGVEFPTYKASFKQWFGVDLPSPAIGFPVEFK